MTDFFKYQLDLLEIELSSFCNAACPQCTRQALNDDRSWFTQECLRIDAIKKIPDYVWDNLKIIAFSGILGDPCAAPNFIPVLTYIRQRAPHVYIKIETNGGMKNKEFWKRLVKAIDNNGHVQFGIDGLSDTNHIYRVNVNWNKLMDNVTTFISSGGIAHWQFIVFEHNEHQVEEVTETAKRMGFKYIEIKKSHRFTFDEIFDLDKVGSGTIPIRPPKNKEYIHKVLLNKKEKLTLDGIFDTSLGKCIDCFVKKERSLFLDVKGRLFPCCFIAGSLHIYEHRNLNDGWLNLWNKHGKDKISLYHHTWEEILDGDFYDAVEKSWNNTKRNETLFACVSSCVNKSSGQVNDANFFGDLQQKIN